MRDRERQVRERETGERARERETGERERETGERERNVDPRLYQNILSIWEIAHPFHTSVEVLARIKVILSIIYSRHQFPQCVYN